MSPSHSSQGPAFLTAATIRHLATASRSALADSVKEQISYRSVKNGTVTSAGADTVTYSGKDWDYKVSSTVPASPSGDGDDIRVVRGQFYITLSGGWQRWTCEPIAPHFPEATTLLRLLSPAARFQDAGTDVIGGVRLAHLRATRLSGLPADPTLARYASLTDLHANPPNGTLTALDAWADSAGVVQQMKIRLSGYDGLTTLTVTFSGSGQPQTITAPPASKAGCP